MRTWLAAVALGAALAAMSGMARPAVGAELSLEPPIPCSNADEIAFLAERALGRPLAALPGPHFVITMATRGAGFSARLETQVDGAALGERAFSAATCTELVETLAVGVAIALGASADAASASAASSANLPVDEVRDGIREEAHAPAAAAGARGARSAPDEASATAPGQSPPGDGPRLAASALLVADSGSLPVPALGAALGAGLRWSGLQLRGAGLLLPPRHGSVDALANGDAGADIELLAGWASACAPLRLAADALELDVCAGWELGRLRATGTGVARSYRKSRLWAAPRLDVAARWEFSGSPLALELLATGLMPLRRDEFILKDIGSVHRAANVIARAGIGLVWAAW